MYGRPLCRLCVPGDFGWIAGAVAGVGWDPGAVCAGAVLVGSLELKWAWARWLWGRTVEAEVGAGGGLPVLSTGDALTAWRELRWGMSWCVLVVSLEPKQT